MLAQIMVMEKKCVHAVLIAENVYICYNIPRKCKSRNRVFCMDPMTEKLSKSGYPAGYGKKGDNYA